MDPTDCRKDMFVKYLTLVRPDIYRGIIEGNEQLVSALYKKKTSENLQGNPLWLLTGGELINLYSTKKNMVPTKDIDCKLYFTGDFSIPPKVWKSAVSAIPNVKLSSFDCTDDKQTQAKAQKLIAPFKKRLSNASTSSVSFYDMWSMGESQKVKMCASLVANSYKGTYSHLNLKTGKCVHGIEYESMNRCSSQPWIHGDKCKAFIVNVPYVTQVGRDNVPYDINNDVLESMGAQYDEDIDGHVVDENFVVDLDKKLQEWRGNPKLNTLQKKQAFLENKLKLIRFKHQAFKLSTVVGVVIVYNEDRGEWYMFQEGLLDLYIDYSAGHHVDLEKRYMGRYKDGTFPTIVKRVPYLTQSRSRKHGIMKFPTMSWLVYDQLRMLYVTLRGEYLACDEDVCKWLPLGGGAAGNSAKYFKKLKGLLSSFEKVIDALQNNADTEKISEELGKCKQKNIEECGPSVFLAGLFEAFESDMSSASQHKQTIAKSKKKTKNTKHKKSHRARKNKRKKTHSNSLQETLERQNNDVWL